MKYQFTFVINVVFLSSYMDGWYVFCLTDLSLQAIAEKRSCVTLALLTHQIPCKHVFCYDCALLHEKKGEKMCPG